MNAQRVKLIVAVGLLLVAVSVIVYQLWPEGGDSTQVSPTAATGDSAVPQVPPATEPYKGGGSRKAPGVK